jgi:hypothetical protein
MTPKVGDFQVYRYGDHVNLWGGNEIYDLEQWWPTDGPRASSGPQLDLPRPPPSHRFCSIDESFNICLILLVQRKI